MSRTAAVVLAGLFAAALTLLSLACGGDGGKEVRVTLDDKSLALSLNQVRAGRLTFVVRNDGTQPHELVVIKTDLPAEGLLLKEGRVDEDKVNISARIEPLAAGESRRLSLDLSAGKYVLICNLVQAPATGPSRGHYQQGEAAALLLTN